ncbi:MAG: hypothetical protein QGH45_12260, partial [Myxococcota bacterium]|nr:hypothetical protein [Myxococcota bacterium]
LIRWARLPVAWSYWAVDYVAYTHGHWLELGQGELPWARLVRLHPGQYALLFALMLEAGLSLRALFWIPILASAGSIAIGAIWLRQAVSPVTGLLFAGLMAVSPYQAHYGLELNNYPLFQLFGAAVLVAAWSAWNHPTRWRLLALGAAVAAALHGHFFAALPIALLGGAALITRRWWVALAVGAGVAVAAPIFVSALSLPGDPETYSAPAERGSQLVKESWLAWVDRFGPPRALAAIGLALLLAVAGTLRRPRRRPLGLLLGGILLLLIAQNYAGFLGGAVRIFQTPYWILPSWIAFALIAVGVEAWRIRWSRLVLLVVLLPWLVPAGLRAIHPTAAGPGTAVSWSDGEGHRELEPGTAADLRDYTQTRVASGDAVVYLWDPWFINDQPHRWDPLFAAFPPGELGPFADDDPYPGYTHRRGDTTVSFVNDTSLRGGAPEATLREALVHWLEAGRRVHLILAHVDPALPPAKTEGLRSWILGRGSAWIPIDVGGVTVIQID